MAAMQGMAHMDGAGARAAVSDHRAPSKMQEPRPRIDRQLGNLERATETLAAIAETRFNEARERGFDFGVDTRVRNLLGRSLFDLARRERGEARKAQREDLLDRAEAQFLAALKIDPEDLSAHYNLAKLYAQRGDEARADAHRALHARYKPDDQAVERAVSLARGKDPIANRTAEAIAIYPLHTPALP